MIGHKKSVFIADYKASGITDCAQLAANEGIYCFLMATALC
jgi:hypothetical protein